MKLGDFERVTDTHVYFVRGPFSQWHYSDFHANNFIVGINRWCGRLYKYNCCEQYMMQNKALLMQDGESARKIMNETSATMIKQYGREIKNFDQELWDSVKFQLVVEGNYWKFCQSKEMQDYLSSTGDRILVEAAHYDSIWGVGLRETDDAILDEANWKGQNLLGKALMIVRDKYESDEFRAERDNFIETIITPLDKKWRG